jgi:D-arabinose 1-dehydrogenase-like Zn-dependent alcohol dehydrogenase
MSQAPVYYEPGFKAFQNLECRIVAKPAAVGTVAHITTTLRWCKCKETQGMLDFWAKHNITCDIELIPKPKINETDNRLMKNDVKYRFVIDMTSLETA